MKLTAPLAGRAMVYGGLGAAGSGAAAYPGVIRTERRRAMKDLARLHAYFVDDTGYWRRMPFVIGALMCVAGTINIWLTIGNELQPWEIVARGVAGGILFALMFPFLFRLLVRWSLRRNLRKPAPADAVHRLVYSIRKSPRMTVPGVLYFSHDAASFAPHAAGALGREVLLPLPELNVSSERVPRGWFMRLLTARDPVAMRLAGSSQSEAFIVPTPSVTIEEMSSVVKEMLIESARGREGASGPDNNRS